MVGAGPSFCEDFENPSSPGWPGMPVSGSGRDVFHTVICCYWEQFVIFILFPYPFPFLPPKKEEEKRKERRKAHNQKASKCSLIALFPLSFFPLGDELQLPLVGNGVLPFVPPPPPHPM